MIPQYRNMMNRQALTNITKHPSDPSARMGIGDDERLSHLDMKVEYVTKDQHVVIPDADTAPYSVTPGSRDMKVEPNDFPQTHFVGDPIQGV